MPSSFRSMQTVNEPSLASLIFGEITRIARIAFEWIIWRLDKMKRRAGNLRKTVPTSSQIMIPIDPRRQLQFLTNIQRLLSEGSYVQVCPPTCDSGYLRRRRQELWGFIQNSHEKVAEKFISSSVIIGHRSGLIIVENRLGRDPWDFKLEVSSKPPFTVAANWRI
jgi:hypothetical protein